MKCTYMYMYLKLSYLAFMSHHVDSLLLTLCPLNLNKSPLREKKKTNQHMYIYMYM